MINGFSIHPHSGRSPLRVQPMYIHRSSVHCAPQTPGQPTSRCGDARRRSLRSLRQVPRKAMHSLGGSLEKREFFTTGWNMPGVAGALLELAIIKPKLYRFQGAHRHLHIAWTSRPELQLKLPQVQPLHTVEGMMPLVILTASQTRVQINAANVRRS